MQTIIHDDRKLVEIWLTNAEKGDPAVQERLRFLCAGFREKKYLVVLFQSGEQDVYTSVRDMLKYNKRKIAENAVMQEKRQRASSMAR